MSRLCVLLFSGVMALPLGCLTLPENDTMAYNTSPSSVQTPGHEEGVSDLSTQQHLTAARAFEGDGREQEAIREYELALQKDPHATGVSWRLAVLHDRQGDFECAETEYRTALQEQPRNADLLNDIGVFHYQRQQSQDAERYLRQALDVNPKHERAWVNLGKVLTQQGRYQASCEAFGHAVRPAQAAANVGILLAKEGKVAEARQVLHKALDLEPDLKPAQMVLTQLDCAGASTR